jgi:GT2 family glycosyltransferase
MDNQRMAKTAYDLANSNRKIEELEHSIDKIKKSPFWALSKPFRMIAHVIIRMASLIKRYGTLKGFARKVKSKIHEKSISKGFGTDSFPNVERRVKEETEHFSRDIKISILVPLYNTPKKFLLEMMNSVCVQTYANWELCLADGSDDAHSYVGDICKTYVNKDTRVIYKKLEKNEGISGNTNQCLKMATGEYIGLFDHDDVLHPSALYYYVKEICKKSADYVYCDEATFVHGNINHMVTLHFKSDYALDTLRANNYICHFSVFARTLLDGTELFRTKFDGSQDHDMILRLTSAALQVSHIPKILYYWRSHKGSVASGIGAKTYAIDAAKRAIAEHLRMNGFEDFEIESTIACETIFRIRYPLVTRPKVSIIIPNKDHVEDLERCISSIIDKSTYDNYEIIVVENNSTSDEIKAYYKKIGLDRRITIVLYKGEFNYSKINNVGVKEATGEYVLLLNNDTQVISVNWMEELLMYAVRSDVGAVGAKLYYANHTIQHAGVVIGLGAHRTAGHTHYGVGRENVGYMGKLFYAQNVTAVTGACLMVETQLYRRLHGLDESFAIALNDVDFCLRLQKEGYANIFNPYCELYHFESISRGSDAQGGKALRYEKEAERFRIKWADELEKGDKYYNPNFSLDRSDFFNQLNK